MTVAEVLTATVRIGAPPADIFPYFTDPALMIQWIGEWADLHPEPGGKFALDISKTPVRGEYVEIEPPRRVVFTWGVAGKFFVPVLAVHLLSLILGPAGVLPGLTSATAEAGACALSTAAA